MPAMALLPERFVIQVQQATDIVDVVGQHVALRKRGKEFAGLCPFHDDHSPSMYVSSAKQIFKCFVCGAGGGVYQFLMLLHKMTFPEAVRELAQRAGIPVPVEEGAVPVDRALTPEALARVTAWAARWFREQLLTAAGQAALAYARGRGLSDESIRHFGLGFAPEGWETLRRAATAQGISDRQLISAGLTIAREDGSCYDRFRNRLIFPILDVSGKVIAFGGRALAAEERAKYLNSPETALFDKSANLYALNWARDQVIKTGRAVVVEGYMDAIIPHQAGVTNVVATLGTALTERHVRTLSRLAKQVVLVFDGDLAGQAATERAIELFLTQRLDVRVATVPRQGGPDGTVPVKDPCDLVLASGGEALQALLDAAPDALEYAWSRRREAYLKAPSLAEKRAVVEDFLRMLVASVAGGGTDAIRQGLLAGHISELVGLPASEVAQVMRRLARTVKQPVASPAGVGVYQPDDFAALAESSLLAALLCAPEHFHLVEERVDPAMFHHPDLRIVAQAAWALAAEGRLELSLLLSTDGLHHLGALVTRLAYEGARWGNYDRVLVEAADNMLHRRGREELQELKTRPDVDKTDILRRQSESRQPDRRRKPRLS